LSAMYFRISSNAGVMPTMNIPTLVGITTGVGSYITFYIKNNT